MPEVAALTPSFLSTLPQWGTFGGVLLILAGLVTVWIKGIPERRRAKSEGESSAAREWAAIEARVNRELDDCKKERSAFIDRVTVVEDENFRLKVAMSLVLGELERIDPESDIVKRAQVIMAAIKSPAQRRTFTDPMGSA